MLNLPTPSRAAGGDLTLGKKSSINTRLSSSSGLILIVVLWILMILTVLTVGIGRMASVEVALLKHALGQLKTKYIGWGAVSYAFYQIKRDIQDEKTGKFDSLYECGLKLDEDKTQEDLFKNIPLGEGFFKISYLLKNKNKEEEVFGFQDEERKINLNAITVENYSILHNLIVDLDFDETTAETVAASIVDWHDQDSQVTNNAFGAEEDYYQGLANPFHCKNLPFDSIQELFLVRGMTPELFDRLKDYVTVFPKDAPVLLVNLNTAPEIVVRALARNFSGIRTNTELEDADSLSRKLVTYRAGDDEKEMTQDDRTIDMNNLGLNAKEQVIYLALERNSTQVSHYFRLKIAAVHELSGVSSVIETVIFRDNLSILSWERE